MGLESCVRYVGSNPLPPPKEAHSGGRGPPTGPLRYVVVRQDGKMHGPFETRHAAAGWIATLPDGNRGANEYTPVPVREGQIPHDDVIPVE